MYISCSFNRRGNKNAVFFKLSKEIEWGSQKILNYLFLNLI